MKAPIKMTFTRTKEPEVISKDIADLDLETLVREELQPLRNIKEEHHEQEENA